MKGEDHLFLEEKEHAKDKKKHRKERKRLSEKDRSKYKKTDVAKQKTPENKEGEKGRVLQITPDGVFCKVDDRIVLCTLKGHLKKEKRLSKNLIAVGDDVIIDPSQSPVIIQILPRTTVLSRADNLSRKKEQVIAANINQVFITASILEPVFKPFLIDRYLIAAYRGNLDPVILITKMDLAVDNKQSLHDIKLIKKMASDLKIPIIFLSTKTNIGIKELIKKAAGKTSVFSGQSGTGKSSLINLLTDANQKAMPVVAKTQKGSHTTTQAIMIPLKNQNGFCVDTPGIRSFGLWEITTNDIRKYFKEIEVASRLCKYPDCHHLSEPDCNVKIMCEKGLISPLRFESYAVLMAEAQQQHFKR